MDKTIFYISLFLLIVGIGGQAAWYLFGGIPCSPPGGNPYLFSAPCDQSATQASFQEMQNVSGFMMILGFIMLPAGLFKDGLPVPGRGARILIGVILVVTIGVVFTAALVLPVSTSTTAQKPNAFITIANGAQDPSTGLSYLPKNVTVIIGQNNTVQWTNKDSAPHTVTSDPGDPASFNSGAMSPGATYVYTFTTPGVYPYYCTFHSWMHGTVTVIT